MKFTQMICLGVTHVIAARGAQPRWPVPPGSAPSARCFQRAGEMWSLLVIWKCGATRMVEGKVRENPRKPCFLNIFLTNKYRETIKK